MKDLDINRIAELIRAAGQAFVSIADLIQAALPHTAAAPAKAEPAAAQPRAVTKEEVRAALAAKSTAGYGKEVRALLQQFGAAQLSDIKPEAYAELMDVAVRIGTEAHNG